jgi:hypothetical protein
LPVFFITVILIIGFLLLFSDLKKAKMEAMKYIFPVLVIIGFFICPQCFHTILFDRVLPMSPLKRMVNPVGAGEKRACISVDLENDILPENILARIGSSKVGIFPLEISYVAANNLNYSPLPVFQAYSAYTSYLDNLDAEFLNGTKAPPYLLMGISHFNYRHWLIDVPATWLSIYKWYEPCVSSESVLLLRRRESPRFETLEPVGTAEYRRTEDVQLPEGTGPLLVKISLDLSLTGKLVKTFYRISPVKIALVDDAGREIEYRVVPDTLKNGIFLNYLPLDLDQAGLLLTGTAATKICSFGLFGEGLKMYQDKMSVQFIKIPEVEISHKPKEVPHFPEGVLKSLKKTVHTFDRINGKLVTGINKITEEERYITLRGWAVDEEAGDSGDRVWVDVDGKTYLAERFQRLDVATFFRKPAYADSGFVVSIPLSSLPKGTTHYFSVKLFAKSGEYYSQSEPEPIVLETPGR